MNVGGIILHRKDYHISNIQLYEYIIQVNNFLRKIWLNQSIIGLK